MLGAKSDTHNSRPRFCRDCGRAKLERPTAVRCPPCAQKLLSPSKG
jgi:ribosomal protein S27E